MPLVSWRAVQGCVFADIHKGTSFAGLLAIGCAGKAEPLGTEDRVARHVLALGRCHTSQQRSACHSHHGCHTLYARAVDVVRVRNALGGEAQPFASVSPCNLGCAGCLTTTVAICDISSSPIRGTALELSRVATTAVQLYLASLVYRILPHPITTRNRPARPLPPWSSRSASRLAA